jgi:hypothetical protein
MAEKLQVQCCIAGGRPAGMVLGYLLGRAQVAVHNRLLKPAISGGAARLKVPWILKALNGNAALRRWPAQIMGLGVRPEQIRSPLNP